MMDACRSGDDVYRVNVSVEVLAQNADDAAEYVDRRLITSTVVADGRFVSFSVTTPRGNREVMA